MNDNTQHTVSESADKINVKVKGNDPEAAAAKLADTLAALESEGVADTLRATQPGDSE